MPVTYKIHPDCNLICKTLSGNVTLAELTTLLPAVLADPDLRRGMDTFVSLEDVTDFDFGYRGMAQFCARVIGLNGTGPATNRRAVYAPGDLAFGMARMYQTLFNDTSSIDVQVFRDLEGACRHLGKPYALCGPAPQNCQPGRTGLEHGLEYGLEHGLEPRRTAH